MSQLQQYEGIKEAKEQDENTPLPVIGKSNRNLSQPEFLRKKFLNSTLASYES